jgi:uncharacterized cupredoxin-like copper-binding protein
MVSSRVVYTALGAIGLALLLAIVAVLVLPLQPELGAGGAVAEEPTVLVTLYGGELEAGRFGFGLSPDNITSPGPTLQFRVGDVVSLTFINVGRIPHSFAATGEKAEEAQVVFDAQVGSGARPLSPDEKGTTVFKVNRPGEFYYVCQVPGHVTLGMWGRMVIEVSGEE